MSKVRGFRTKEGDVGSIFNDIYVVDGRRTPFGKYTGTLSTVSPTDLGIAASRAVLKAAGVKPTDVDQTYVANIGQASADSFFLPRHVALYSGVRQETPALLVQRICGSGIELIGGAAEQIGLGKSDLVLGCGTETMSRFPLVSFGARQGFQLGKPDYVDMLWAALDDTAAVPMGATADNLAKECQLKRDEVDSFAKRSQERYFAAAERGVYADEICAMENGVFEAEGLKARKVRLSGADRLDRDENPRQTTMEKLGKLPFVFSKEGPTTAGSASGIVDGAASVLIASQSYVTNNKIKPLGKVIGMASVGVRPDIMGIGPVPAIRGLLGQIGLKISEIDLFEINEAFGAQCLAVARTLGVDEALLNVNGGAIAIGHPLAASGTRLVMTCLKELRRRGKKYGVASACIGGGQGIAMVVEAC